MTFDMNEYYQGLRDSYIPFLRCHEVVHCLRATMICSPTGAQVARIAFFNKSGPMLLD